ncbi:hypothetical protein DFS34DRAFT_602774 [Phlyctochytrium arcticum]|nr:hypothetical protein DFS34DRAFT_602774 [Phlyctochytrium arcticum]
MAATAVVGLTSNLPQAANAVPGPSAFAAAAQASAAAAQAAAAASAQANLVAAEALAAASERRTSLLDVVRDGLQRQGKTSVLYRLVVCGMTKGADRQEILAQYQKFFKQYQTDTDLITGLLILYPDTYVHLLECSTKIAYAFMRSLGGQAVSGMSGAGTSSQISSSSANSLSSHQQPKEGATTHPIAPSFPDSRVLLVLDDVPSRMFPFWAARMIEQRGGDFMGAGGFGDLGGGTQGGDDEVDEEVLAETCIGLCRVGVGLSTMGKTDLKTALDELSTQFKDFMPRPDLLSQLTMSKNIMSIREWLETYDGSLDFCLESELVWPAQKSLVF